MQTHHWRTKVLKNSNKKNVDLEAVTLKSFEFPLHITYDSCFILEILIQTQGNIELSYWLIKL